MFARRNQVYITYFRQHLFYDTAIGRAVPLNNLLFGGTIFDDVRDVPPNNELFGGGIVPPNNSILYAIPSFIPFMKFDSPLSWPTPGFHLPHAS